MSQNVEEVSTSIVKRRDEKTENIESVNNEKVENFPEENEDEYEVFETTEEEYSSAIVFTDEEKSIISQAHKNKFLKKFYAALKVPDILDDLRKFVENKEVLKQDQAEVQQLVAIKVAEEKAKKKLEKIKKEDAVENEPTKSLANAIKNIVGIDLAGVLKNNDETSKVASLNVIPVINGFESTLLTKLPQVAPIEPGISLNKEYPINHNHQSAFSSTNVTFNSAPYQTVQPVVKLKMVTERKKSFIRPVPNLSTTTIKRPAEVPPIPDILLPTQFRKNVNNLIEPGTKRWTLRLAGARPRKFSLEKNKLEVKQEQKNLKLPSFKERIEFANNQLPEGVPSISSNILSFRKSASEPSSSLIDGNQAVNGLHKNSPLSVKRYHAKLLAKETGMSLEEAMIEIEDQCREFGPASTTMTNNVSELNMNSRGIPGIDRPPRGSKFSNFNALKLKPKKRGGVKEREKRRRRAEVEHMNKESSFVKQGKVHGEYQPKAKYSRNDYYKDDNAFQESKKYESYYGTTNTSEEYVQGYKNYSEEQYDANYDYYQGQDVGTHNYNEEYYFKNSYQEPYSSGGGEIEKEIPCRRI